MEKCPICEAPLETLTWRASYTSFGLPAQPNPMVFFECHNPSHPLHNHQRFQFITVNGQNYVFQGGWTPIFQRNKGIFIGKRVIQ
jgi:hypothetical protein